jgi:rhodanese-related sulfurtransferase
VSKKQLVELFYEYEADEDEHISETLGDADGPRVVTYSEAAKPLYEKPYLIYDTREVDQFRVNHIIQARSYPLTMMKRDNVHPELYKYRNKPETLIVLYCDDERTSREAAKLLVDRGIDNVFLLTSGLNEFAYAHSSFVEGTLPVLPEKHTLKMSRNQDLGRIPEDSPYSLNDSGYTPGMRTPALMTRRDSARGRGSRGGDYSARSSASGAGRYMRGDDTRSESGMSSASTRSVAESVISRAASRKGKL